jgi:chaperonin GroEL (HSP60 family)
MIHAIGASIGPEGRGTLYQSGTRVARAHSGVDIARRCCGQEGAGGLAQILFRETLVQANKDLGDGTARLAVMSGAALEAGQKVLVAGIEPGVLSRRIAALRPEIDAAFGDVTLEDIGVADQMAASGLPNPLRDALAEALAVAGEDGQVELVQGQALGHVMKSHGGFVLDVQAIEQSPLEALEDVSLIVADDIIRDFRTLTPVIEGFARANKALIIAARGVEDGALALLERNRKAGVLTVTALKPAEAGPRAAILLEDLAIATGAHLVAERTGLTLNALKPQMLGHAKSYRRTGGRMTLIGAEGAPEAINMRLKEISGEIEASRHLSLDLEHARRRHARMKGQWVELALNTGDEPTTQTLIDEAQRALASLAHARRGGVLPGSGVGLARIAEAVLSPRPADPVDRAARTVIAEALRAPARHILQNAGQEPLTKDLSHDPERIMNVYDPSSLSRALLDQALSLATQLLSLERAVVRC